MVDWNKFSEEGTKKSKDSKEEKDQLDKKALEDHKEKLLKILEEVRLEAESGSGQSIKQLNKNDGYEFTCNGVSLILKETKKVRPPNLFQYNVKYHKVRPTQFTQNVKEIRLNKLDSGKWYTGEVNRVPFSKYHAESMFEILLSQATR